MSYRVEILPFAARRLRKLPPEEIRHLQATIDLLAENPRPPGAKKLTNRPEWRIRTGNYRVLYLIEDNVLTIVVVNLLGHRRDIYR